MRIIQLTVIALLFAGPTLAQEPAAEPAPPTTTITGTLLSADGQPIEMAHVGLYPLSGGAAIESAEVAADGSYVLETDSVGVFSLWYTGVDCLMQSRALLLDGAGGAIEIDVGLGTHDFQDDLSEVAVIGEFNDFAFGQDDRPMELQDDGTYVLEIEWDADTLAYQLINIVSGRSINGTQSDRFVYDGGGDYRSVISVADGVARIVFDPQKLHVIDAAPSVQFGDPEGLQARYASFAQFMQDRRAEYYEERRALQEEGASDEELRSFGAEYDWSDVDAALEDWLDETSDPDLRGTLLLTYVSRSVRTDSLYARMALAEVEPASPKWGMAQFLLPSAIDATGHPEAYEDFLYAALRENPSEALKPDVLFQLLWQAHEDHNENETRILYAWLVSEYPDEWQAQYARSEFDPNRAVREGQPVPEFEIASLEDSTVIYSNQGLAGQVYLIDFWAVWCGPCIAEMPYLHAAYEKYGQDGFTILSLSFDDKPEDVIEHREKGEWTMPWLHAFVEDGFGSELAKTFQVYGIPKPVLVGKDGTILATYRDLHGEKLDETLAGVFGREPTVSEEESR